MKSGSWSSPVFGLIGAALGYYLLTRTLGSIGPLGPSDLLFGSWLAVVFAMGLLAAIFAGAAVQTGPLAFLHGAVAGLLSAVVPIWLEDATKPPAPMVDLVLLPPPDVALLIILGIGGVVGSVVGGFAGLLVWAVLHRPWEDGKQNLPG